MSFTEKQAETISTMCGIGFAVANVYADGVVRMRVIGGDVSVFVRRDGTTNHPSTPATMTARVAMSDAGIEVQ